MIVLTYRIETPGSTEALAAKIASDQSTGTFVELPGETPELKARVAARVLAIRQLEPTRHAIASRTCRRTIFNRAEVDIGFPIEAVGTDLSALMTIAIGGTFSIKGLTGIRVVDMKLPEEFRGAHPGPQFGVAGSRRLTGVDGPPDHRQHRQAGAGAAAARDAPRWWASWSTPASISSRTTRS